MWPTFQTMLVDPENDVELDTGIYNPGFAEDNAGNAKDNAGYAKDNAGYAKDNTGYAGSVLPDVETVPEPIYARPQRGIQS